MLTKIEPPILDPDQPWKGDLFKRGPFATTLCSLLRDNSHASVIGLGAGYGFGKTFFLRRLREQIKSDGGWTIYVNAWEYDYLDSPLLALLDALKVAGSEQTDRKEVKKAFKSIAKAAAPAILKAATKKALEVTLGADASKDFAEVIAEATGKSVEALANRIVTEDTTHYTLDLLREEIRNFIDRHLTKNSKYKTLIVIVDELDRARPDFCIRFLETIKHVFSMSQVTFLIGCDQAVLRASARHEFGSDLPIDGYLRRLFDYWIDLPAPKAMQYAVHCAMRLNLIADGLVTDDRDANNGIATYADLMLTGHERDASLRFVEQSVAHVGVILRLGPRNTPLALLGWLQGLRHFALELHELYVRNGPVGDVYRELANYGPFANQNPYNQARILAWAANNKEPLLKVIDGALGSPNNLSTMIRNLQNSFHDRAHLDEPQSLAFETDRQLRAISLHVD
jgi:hypothetical protein